MSSYVEQKVQEKLDRIKKIDEQIKAFNIEKSKIEIELSVYKDILEHDIRPIEQKSKDDRQKSRMSDNWKLIMREIASNFPDSVDSDYIRFVSQTNNIDFSDETLRSQLSTYTSRGWLERVGFGKYRITIAGANVVDYAFSPGQAAILRRADDAANSQQNLG